MPDYSPTLQTKKFGTLNYGDLKPVSISGYKTGQNFVSESISEKNSLNQALSSIGGKAAVTQFAGPAGNYLFIPEDFLTKGFASNNNVWTPKGILDPKHLDPFLKQAEYVDFSKLGATPGQENASIGKGYDEFFKGVGQTPKGFLIPTDAKNGDGYSFENQLYITDPIKVQDKLTQQILGQGTTGKWSGEGYGSPAANASMMAAILAASGITDIRDFGKIDQVLYNGGGQFVTLKDPNDPSKGGYVVEKFIEQPNGDIVEGKKIELTPERLAKMQPWYVHDDQTGGGPVLRGYTVQDVPVVRETFGNKLTNTPVQSNYAYRGGNIFSGTTTGKDQTNFGVQFAPDGTPVFFTSRGKPTTSWGMSAGEFLPLASFALNFVVPGAGEAIGTALGITSKAVATAVGNSIISGAMAEAAGGDFWKAAAGSAVSSAVAGAGGKLPSTGSAIVDKAISGGLGAALTGGDAVQGALSGAITAGINEYMPTTGNKIADTAISSGVRAALTGGDVGQAIVSGAMSGASSAVKDAAKSGTPSGSATAATPTPDPAASAGSDTVDVTAPTGGAGSDEITTRTVTDEDGTQFVYDQQNNLIDIIAAGQDSAPGVTQEAGVSTDTSGAVTAVPPVIQQPDLGVSTDTSGAETVAPITQPTTPPAAPELGVSTDTSGAVAQPPVTQPTETQQPVSGEPDAGVSTDTTGAEAQSPVTQPDTQPSVDPGVSTDTSGAEPGAQPSVDQAAEQQPEAGQGGADDQETPTCAPGYTWDPTRQICVPDDDERQERAETGLDEPAPSCAEGYTWDETRQICVANDDPAAESQECPEGYIYDLGARACVKATSVATGSGGGGGGGGGTSNAGGASGTPVTQVQRVTTPAERPISRAIVDEPMRRIGLPIYEKMSEFEGPLSDFLEMVRTGSYISKPNQPEQPMQPNMNQQTQPDRLDQPAAPGGYFNYGQESSIDSILNPGSELQGFARGGMATPLMAAGGTTRYGMNSGGALDVIHHSGKPRLDFREGAAVTGEGDGQSDDIPAMLADGEFVFPADVVAALGNGSTKAGSDKLYEMMHSIRAYHRSAKPEDLPPPAKKSPLDYLKKPAKKARK